MRQNQRKDIFVIGFALFSMFFGAGNVIFPPFLGLGAGPEWLMGYFCYYLADIGLALAALYSMFRKGGADVILKPVGRVPSTILMCAVVLCIGPMLAIPRATAMTFEMSVLPFISHPTPIMSVLFSVAFFLVVFLLTIRKNSVVDIVGKFLTPALLLGLMILIVKGVITPLGRIAAEPQVSDVATSGIKAGYQTMDVLATVLFGAIIMNSAEEKGYTEPGARHRVSVGSGLVAGISLMVVYGGLTYLGATASGLYDQSIGRSALVMNIVRQLLGGAGSVIFALVVGLACMTTAVGLVSSCATYFSELSRGKLSYPVLVTAICVFSAVVSNVGLDTIVSIAAPVLDIVYPPMLMLILISYIPGVTDFGARVGTGTALAFSVLGAAHSYLGVELSFLNGLPLAELGLGWLLPAVAACGVSMVFQRPEKGAAVTNEAGSRG